MCREEVRKEDGKSSLDIKKRPRMRGRFIKAG